MTVTAGRKPQKLEAGFEWAKALNQILVMRNKISSARELRATP